LDEAPSFVRRFLLGGVWRAVHGDDVTAFRFSDKAHG
jgi:hypothetical protein